MLTSLAGLTSSGPKSLVAVTIDGAVSRGFLDEHGSIRWERLCSLTGLPESPSVSRVRILSARSGELYLSGRPGELWRLDPETGRLASVEIWGRSRLVTFEALLDIQDGMALFTTTNGCLARGPLSSTDHGIRLHISDCELLSGQWSRFTRLFSGMGFVFAESCTGEGVWYSLDHMSHIESKLLSPVLGESILSAGFRSFSSIAPASGSSFFGADSSGVLYHFRLTGGRDSDGRPARECAGTRVGASFEVSGPCGYSWPICVSSGDKITFFVASSKKYRLEIVDLVRETPREASEIAAEWFNPCIQLFQAGSECRWDPAFDFLIPESWPSSIWSARLSTGDDESFDIVFVTKPPQSAEACSILALASTNTWNAYNSWGGASKYGPMYQKSLSFRRPNPAVSPVWDGFPNHLLVSDLWILRTLLALGYHFEFISDWEMEDDAEHLAHAKVLILLSHPEYWSHRMRDNLEGFLNGGGSLVYLGGNGLFELCSLEGGGTDLGLFPFGEPPERAPSYFRNLIPPRPERPLLGVAFRFDVDWKADPLTHLAGSYSVLEPDHWAFEGCAAVRGDLIGTVGRNAGGACGWEMDTSAPGAGGEGVVSARGYDDRGSPPDGLRILARGTQSSQLGDDYGADMTIYETPAGGIIFSAGSICFGGSLAEDGALQTVISNVLDRAIG